MGTYRFSVRVVAPPEQVFDLWTDLDRAPEWIEGLSKITDVSGPLDRKGATYTAWFGRMKSPTEVLDVDRPRFIRTRFGSVLLRGETEATFEPEANGTRIIQVFRTRGLVPAIFGWLFSLGSYKGSFRGELETFRKLAERDAAVAGH